MIGRDKNEGISDLLNTIFYLLYSTVEIPSFDVKKNADSLIENRKYEKKGMRVWRWSHQGLWTTQKYAPFYRVITLRIYLSYCLLYKKCNMSMAIKL